MFWKDVLKSYSELYEKIHDIQSFPFENQSILYNKCIQIDNKPIIDSEFSNNQIYYIHQLKEQGKYLAFDEFRNKHKNVRINYLHYLSVITAIKKSDKQHKSKETPVVSNKNLSAWEIILKDKKGTRSIYKKFNEHEYSSKGFQKWEDNEFGKLDWLKLFTKLHSTTIIYIKHFRRKLIFIQILNYKF